MSVVGIGFQYFAARAPEEVAVVDPTGAQWTRRALGELVSSVSRGFLAAGFVPGDAIAIIAPNCAEYLAVHLAGVYAGLSSMLVRST